MSPPTSNSRQPITDSPWFWLYLFSTFGLLFLYAAEPKLRTRQVQIERQYQARVRAREIAKDQQATTPVSTEHNLLVSTRPLYLVLGVLVLVGWISLWYRRFKSVKVPPDQSSDMQRTEP